MLTQRQQRKEWGTDPKVINGPFCYGIFQRKHFLVCHKACPFSKDYNFCEDYTRYNNAIRFIRLLQALARNGLQQPLLPGMEQAYMKESEDGDNEDE